MEKCEVLKYSKNQVKKAVQILIGNQVNLEEKLKAYSILANFRSSHIYPMQSMMKFFTQKSFEIDQEAIIVKRLKRMPSILAKLKREKTMKIDTMGDIGGIRIIVANIEKVNALRDAILKGSTQNILIAEKDYIKCPKTSGYRSIHLIYKYQTHKQEYQGLKVELQIRSNIQHTWATAVEVIGTFNKENLKSSQGNQEWLHFFKLVSVAFQCLEEKQKISKALKQEILDQEKHLKVINKMQSYAIITNQVEDINKDFLLLLYLDIDKKTIRVNVFDHNFLSQAYEEYRRLETEITEDESKDAVLVSVNSIQDLKEGYPNYFADTKNFIHLLKQVVS